MKRLLDEPTDEVTRLLLRAAANHQPPRSGKARLIASLGLGGAIGLWSTQGFAWLGTGGGKVALAVTILGASAGGVYVMTNAMAVPAAAPVELTRAAPTRQQTDPEIEGAFPSVPPPPPEAATIERDPPRAPAKRRRTRAAAPSTESAMPPQPDAERESLRLTEETTWVDRMRVAAETNDRRAFEDVARGYQERFPEGQLAPEVTRLRASFHP